MLSSALWHVSLADWFQGQVSTVSTDTVLQDSAEIVAALLQLLESEPTLALEKAIKTCLVSAMEAGTDIAMHQLPGICIKAAASQMRGQRPQAQDVHRAELFLRLLTIFTEMKPSICCGHLEDLLKIRTCVLRVNDMGGTKGVVLQNTILRILMLMASDPTCRAEVCSHHLCCMTEQTSV